MYDILDSTTLSVKHRSEITVHSNHDNAQEQHEDRVVSRNDCFTKHRESRFVLHGWNVLELVREQTQFESDPRSQWDDGRGGSGSSVSQERQFLARQEHEIGKRAHLGSDDQTTGVVIEEDETSKRVSSPLGRYSGFGVGSNLGSKTHGTTRSLNERNECPDLVCQIEKKGLEIIIFKASQWNI